MSTLDQRLFEPVSEAQPSGADYSYDPKLDELEKILKGKEEVEIGALHQPAEPPDWVELRDKSNDFLVESKHLRVATMLCCSLLRTQGLTGFRDGLGLIKFWLEKYWPSLFPLLDPEDNNDPTQRLNIIGALTAPRGSVSGYLTFVDYLYLVEVFRPKGAAPVTFEQILLARAPSAEGNDPLKLAAGIADPGKIACGLHEVLNECRETVRQIDQLLTGYLGSGGAISFEALDKTLQELISALKLFGVKVVAEPGVPVVAAADGGEAPVAIGGVAPEAALTGAIHSREDVVRALELICTYYKRVEPGSPVPYLLRRAQKLARMDFVQVMNELNLATVDTLRPSMGSALDADAPPAETT